MLLLRLGLLLDFLFSTLPNVTKMCVGKDYCFPRIIWSHWTNDNISEEILDMISTTRRSLVNFTYYFLTNANISDYLDVNEFPKNFSQIHDREKSQFFRLALLEKYGGVWVDSTTYVNSGKEMEWFFSKAVKAKCQMVGFGTRFIWPEFIGASENSVLIKKWKDEFVVALADPEEYVNITCSILEGAIRLLNNCRPHFIVDLSQKKMAFDNSVLFDIGTLQLPKKRSHYVLLKTCKYKKKCFADALNSPEIKKMPFVKVRHTMLNYWRKHKKKNVNKN